MARSIAVSIHALTRSATLEEVNNKLTELVSIHALTRSATVPATGTACSECCFNPRTHEECDSYFGRKTEYRVVSIHALTRSATASGPGTGQTAAVSIHALTRSATKLTCRRYVRPMFQSTHSRGVRLLLVAIPF